MDANVHTVRSFVDQGDAFADEWTFVGTRTGPLALPDGTRLPPTGKRVEVKGMEFVAMRDGKIVVDNLYYDLTGIADGDRRLEHVPQAVGA